MRRTNKNRIERIQPETFKGQYFFQDLYSREVYFEDLDDKSTDYFRLDFNPSFEMFGGRNLISLRGNSSTMELGSEILIEAVDGNGELLKTQIFDTNDEINSRAIAVEINELTPPGDIIVTIMGVASEAPDGTPIPLEWIGIPNFRWTRVFTAKPFTPNKSSIRYSEFDRPVITIQEIQKPYY